jgi:hypothetical protein
MAQAAGNWEALSPTKTSVVLPQELTISTKRKYGWLGGFVVGALIVWLLLYILKPGFVLIKDPNTGLNTASINNTTMGIWVLIGGIIGALVTK